MITGLEILAGIVTAFASLIQLTALDWRGRIGLLALQYLAVFFLIGLVWPLALAVIFLVSGWFGAAVLGMAVAGLPGNSLQNDSLEPSPGSNTIFNLISSAIILLMAYTYASQTAEWLPRLDEFQSGAALLLVGLGILQLAFSSSSLSVSIGLMTIVSGFEVMYAGLTNSQFAVGLLAVITLFIALAGAYWMLAPSLEEQP